MLVCHHLPVSRKYLLTISIILQLAMSTTAADSIDDRGCKEEVVEVDVSSDPSTIRSPGYPVMHPSPHRCRWMISARRKDHLLELTFTDVHFGESPSCSQDGIRVYDVVSPSYRLRAFLCSQEDANRISTIRSSSYRLLMEYTIPVSSKGRGFKAKVKSVSQDSNEYSEALAFTFGVTGGSFVVIILIVVLVLACSLRRQQYLAKQALFHSQIPTSPSVPMTTQRVSVSSCGLPYAPPRNVTDQSQPSASDIPDVHVTNSGHIENRPRRARMYHRVPGKEPHGPPPSYFSVQ